MPFLGRIDGSLFTSELVYARKFASATIPPRRPYAIITASLLCDEIYSSDVSHVASFGYTLSRIGTREH